MLIQFESVTREDWLLSSLKNFDPVTQTIEHRKHPLTGRGVIVLKERMGYVRRFIESDESSIEDLTNSTQKGLPVLS